MLWFQAVEHTRCLPGCQLAAIAPTLLVAFAGQLVVCLFVLVNSLTFTNVCLCSIFHVAAVVLAAQDPHVGSKLTAAAAIIGPLWFGSIIAGCVVSQAQHMQALPKV